MELFSIIHHHEVLNIAKELIYRIKYLINMELNIIMFLLVLMQIKGNLMNNE